MGAMRLRRLQLCLAALGLFYGVRSHALSQGGVSCTGTWNGSIQAFGTPLDITVRLVDADVLSGTIDIPSQNARELKLTDFSRTGPELSFSIAGVPGNATFIGVLSESGDSIAGDFVQNGATYPFALARYSEIAIRAKEDSLAASLEWIRSRIGEAIESMHAPGVAVAIVMDGKIVMQEGFGMCDLQTREPVTASTIFMIGSASKAFTATLLGTIVDSGLLEWNDVVSERLSGFRLYDNYATLHLTVNDLLSHVSGLPRTDLVWYSSTKTRRELLAAMKYLQPSAELREKFQYQNLMFMSAGILAEELLGRPWEELLRDRILRPLGMSSTTSSLADLMAAPDRATGYKAGPEGDSITITPTPYRNIDAIGPAGSVNSNAHDLARWLLFNLGNGTISDTLNVIQKSTLEYLHTPRVVVNGNASSESGSVFTLYALGWMATAYRGDLLIEHGGNIDGFSSLVSFLPGRNIGVAVLTNIDGSALPNAVSRIVIDRLTHAPTKDWIGQAVRQTAQVRSIIESRDGDGPTAIQVHGTSPSHEFSEYAGTYTHPAYGELDLDVEGGALRLRSRTSEALAGRLEHFHYDYFRISGNDNLSGLFVAFQTGKTGRIESLTIPLEPLVDPVRFVRIPSHSMATAEGLSPYAGAYELAGLAIEFSIEGNHLVMTIPGQNAYRLQPVFDDEFRIHGEDGYSVRFTITDGRATDAILIQPDGVYRATRKEE